MADEREQAAFLRWIAGLSDKQFTELFYAAVRDRVTSDQPEWHGHFVLAEAEELDGEWQVHLVGLPRDESWVDDAPLCQEGRCGTCGSSVLSWAKSIVCPVCGEPVKGT